MQILRYSKNSSNPTEPVNIDIDSSQSNKIPDVCGGEGNVCLISQSAYRPVSKIFAKSGFIDCGLKGKKIDLKRALKLDEKKNRELPRLVLFDTSSAGAFKRGFNAFYTKHFTASDPACLIIIPDNVFAALKNDMATGSEQREASAESQ